MTGVRRNSTARLPLPPDLEARARALELSIAMGVYQAMTPEFVVARAEVFAKFIEHGSIPPDAETIA